VSKADKRERQRQNRELAKIERERLIKRDRRMRSLRGLLFVLVPVIIIAVLFNVLRSDDDGDSGSKAEPDTPTAPKMTINPAKTYTASIETSKGTIEVALDPKTAPIATNNFVALGRKGFYDDLCIDRAAKDFVIQGGSPKCDQQGGPGYTVKGEVPTDNYPVGSLAAAKGGQEPPGTMGSQFFIVTGPNGATLPNDYARFGNVTSGLEVAQAIEKLAPASGDGKPTEKVTIKKITISES
jgi:cyclophilin family peptidyl-prolyl cis-trans isomerase